MPNMVLYAYHIPPSSAILFSMTTKPFPWEDHWGWSYTQVVRNNGIHNIALIVRTFHVDACNTLCMYFLCLCPWGFVLELQKALLLHRQYHFGMMEEWYHLFLNIYIQFHASLLAHESFYSSFRCGVSYQCLHLWKGHWCGGRVHVLRVSSPKPAEEQEHINSSWLLFTMLLATAARAFIAMYLHTCPARAVWRTPHTD